MKKLILSLGIFALTFVVAHGAAFAQSSVSDDGGASNTLVSASATTAAAAQASSQVAAAASSAVGGAAAGSIVHLDHKNPMQSAFNFNSRAIAGKSAGSSPRAGFWIQSGYTYVDNDENGGQFDGNIISVVAGFDYKPAKFNNKLVVGIAAGYENLDIDTAFNNGTFEGDGFTITPYAGYSFNKRWSISALAGIGFIDYENSRNNGGVNGDFEALRAFGSVNLTGNYRLKNKWRLTPSAGVMGLWEEQDSYNETGTSTAAVGKTSVHLVRINAGLEVGYQIKKSIEPFVSARLQYDPDRNSAVTLTTGSTASDDELGGVFGAGLNLSGKKVNGQIKYETQQFKNELQTHSVIGRVRFNF